MHAEEKRNVAWRAVTGPRIDPRYRARFIDASNPSAHFESARDAYVARTVDENLKDCILIGPEQGLILRCMVYGVT